MYAALDDGGKLVVHLRMTGRLLLAEAGEASAAHTRAAFLLDNGRSYWVSFEAGYPDSVQQGFTEGGGSGTITSEAYTDKDYGEI